MDKWVGLIGMHLNFYEKKTDSEFITQYSSIPVFQPSSSASAGLVFSSKCPDSLFDSGLCGLGFMIDKCVIPEFFSEGIYQKPVNIFFSTFAYHFK